MFLLNLDTNRPAYYTQKERPVQCDECEHGVNNACAALVSRRAYKGKMSFEDADRIMMDGMGTRFAPEMKDVYCRTRPKLEAYYSSL